MGRRFGLPSKDFRATQLVSHRGERCSLIRRVFERDPLACPVCEQAMTPLTLVRSGAHGGLEWLGRTGELVLHGPPPRGDPGVAAHGPA